MSVWIVGLNHHPDHPRLREISPGEREDHAFESERCPCAVVRDRLYLDRLDEARIDREGLGEGASRMQVCRNGGPGISILSTPCITALHQP